MFPPHPFGNTPDIARARKHHPNPSILLYFAFSFRVELYNLLRSKLWIMDFWILNFLTQQLPTFELLLIDVPA